MSVVHLGTAESDVMATETCRTEIIKEAEDLSLTGDMFLADSAVTRSDGMATETCGNKNIKETEGFNTTEDISAEESAVAKSERKAIETSRTKNVKETEDFNMRGDMSLVDSGMVKSEWITMETSRLEYIRQTEDFSATDDIHVPIADSGMAKSDGIVTETSKPRKSKETIQTLQLQRVGNETINVTAEHEQFASLVKPQAHNTLRNDEHSLKQRADLLDISAPQTEKEHTVERESDIFPEDFENQQTTDKSVGDKERIKGEFPVKKLKEIALSETSDENDHGKTHEFSIVQERGFEEAKKKYTYFWRSRDIFSQWHPATFKVGSKTFSCAEQYMMYQKASFFGSHNIAEQILTVTHPWEMKALGRLVTQFEENVWALLSLGIVRDGNMHKYTQNFDMKEALFSTYPTILVEASPFDSIWGIGLDKHDQRAWDQSTWEGMNLLGYILTEVRDELMFKDRIITEDSRRVYLDDLQKRLSDRNIDTDPGTSVDGDWVKVEYDAAMYFYS